MAAHQLVGVIELGTRQQIQTSRINQHFGAAALDNQVVLLRRLIQFEAILEAAAAAGQNRDTQRSLSAMGSFMMMGVVGLIVASLLNVFLLHSTGLQFGLSILCVLIFAGLTAWDTQAIKAMYFAGDTYEMAQKKSIHGALRLYLDFINMFQAILMLTGSQRNN